MVTPTPEQSLSSLRILVHDCTTALEWELVQIVTVLAFFSRRRSSRCSAALDRELYIYIYDLPGMLWSVCGFVPEEKREDHMIAAATWYCGATA